MDEKAASITLDDSRFPFVEVVVVERATPAEIQAITAQLDALCERGLFALQWTLKPTCPRIAENDRKLYLDWYRNNRERIDRRILAVAVVMARPVHRAAFIAFSWLAKTGAFFRGFLGEAEATTFLHGVLRTHRLQVPHEDADERSPTPASMLY